MNGKVLIANDDFLSHHGTEGMRWGKRNGPPYPLNAAGKAALLKQRKAEKVARLADKQIARATKKAKRKEEIQKFKEDAKRRKEEKKIKDLQKEKERAISSNSYQRLYDIKDKLTYQELKDAFNRIDLEQDIYAKANPKPKSLVDKIDSLMRGVDKATGWTNTGIKAYNQMALLFNNTDDVINGKTDPWKIISSNAWKKNDNDKNDNDKNDKNKNK